MHRGLLQIAAQRLRDDLRHVLRGAARRVLLEPVMHLGDLDVVLVAQRLGHERQELERQRDGHRHVGRDHDRRATRERGDLLALGGGEAGGADHHRPRVLEVRERAFRPREIDQHIAARRLRRIGTYADGARLRPGGRAAGNVERAAELELAIGEHRFDQRAAHPAVGAGDRRLERAHRPVAGEATSPSMRASLPSLKKSATRRLSRLPDWDSRQYT